MTKDVFLLPVDREYALKRIKELERQIQDMGPEFQDVFTQSSETWHDNAPFDALRDRQSVLAAELDELRTLIRHSTLTKPRAKKGTVGVGSIVSLENGKRYEIAGDWTHRAGVHDDGVTTVSCAAPLAQALLGNKVGDHIAFAKIDHKILQIEESGS